MALMVWLCGRPVGVLRPWRRSVELRYDEWYVQEQGEGALGLSTPLPVRRRSYRGEAVETWMECLLPEGEMRTTLERLFRIRRGDGFGLLEVLGRDCAGAVAFTPEGQILDVSPEPVQLTWADLSEAIRSLPEHPLGVDEEVRVSLGGLQSKLLLLRTADGWATPTDGAPSTHILKPDPPQFPGLVVAEAFAQRAALLSGLRAAAVELVEIDGRPVLVVERFDREMRAGTLVRLHQEDGCQALSLNPVRHKYQGLGGPASYRALAGVLAGNARSAKEELRRLGALMTFTVAIGNTDAHLRNHGLLHIGKTLELAPVYDAAPTVDFVRTRQLALWVADQSMLSAVGFAHLVDEMAAWGLAAEEAESVAAKTLRSLLEALPEAAEAFPGLPDPIVEGCMHRTRRLLA